MVDGSCLFIRRSWHHVARTALWELASAIRNPYHDRGTKLNLAEPLLGTSYVGYTEICEESK